jgi:predicted CoA-substrate-specific enzyme activase
LVARALIGTGANVTSAAENAFAEVLKNGGIDREQVAYIVGTGYGRYKVTFGDTQITEISCHARGAVELFPGTRTVLDMGGQDTKAIRVQPDGEVVDFCMNDKCAAGTGRFIEASSFVLSIPLDELGPVALKAQKPVRISTTCTVFAESELLSWLGRGKRIEDILMGVHRSMGTRSMALLRRVGIEQEVTFTGGVARNVAMVQVLEEMLGFKVNVSEESHYIGAVGAAVFALERALGAPQRITDSAEAAHGIEVGTPFEESLGGKSPA